MDPTPTSQDCDYSSYFSCVSFPVQCWCWQQSILNFDLALLEPALDLRRWLVRLFFDLAIPTRLSLARSVVVMESRKSSLTFVRFHVLPHYYPPHTCERLPFGLTYVGGNSPDTNRQFEPGTALSHGGASASASLLRFCSPTPLSSRTMS